MSRNARMAEKKSSGGNDIRASGGDVVKKDHGNNGSQSFVIAVLFAIIAILLADKFQIVSL